MKYRPQRGTLADSMAAVVDLEPTVFALAMHLRVEVRSITVRRYRYDRSLNWDTYIVTVGNDVRGYTDGLVLHKVYCLTGCRECQGPRLALLGVTDTHERRNVLAIRCKSCTYHTFQIPAELKLFLGPPPT